jgi:hypothetical protein
MAYLIENKRCSKCRIKKSASDFWHSIRSSDGLQTHCKQCTNERKGIKKIEPFVYKEPSFDEKLEYAWAAGFLDGEGCFSLTKKKGTHPLFRSPLISVAQVHREPLDVLVTVMDGGKVTFNQITVSGKIAYQWRLQNKRDVCNSFPYIIPYLCNKRRQAEIVLKFAQFRNCRGGAYTKKEIEEREIVIEEFHSVRNEVM